MFEELSHTQIVYLIDEWIHNQRDREIIKSRLLDGLTYERLGEMYDLSVTHTKTIVKRSIGIISKHI